MIYINTYSNIIYQTSQQRCTRPPCILKERRECPTAAWNISLPVKKKRENTFYLQKIYIGQYLSFRNRDGDACKCEKVKKQTFQESSRCSWEWYRVHCIRYSYTVPGTVTLYQVQGTLYQVLGTGWTGVAKHSKAQVPKILLGAIPHSTSWLDISHLQSVL